MARERVRWDCFLFYKEPLPRGQILLHLLTPSGLREAVIAIRSHSRGRDLPWFVPLEIVSQSYRGRLPILEEVTVLSPSPDHTFADPLTHSFRLFVGELLHLGIPEGAPHPRLFTRLSSLGLKRVDSRLWGEVPAFILEEMGVFHVPSRCSRCGGNPAPEAWVYELLCPSCAPSAPSPFEACVGPYRLPLLAWIRQVERVILNYCSKTMKTPPHIQELLPLIEAIP